MRSYCFCFCQVFFFPYFSFLFFFFAFLRFFLGCDRHHNRSSPSFTIIIHHQRLRANRTIVDRSQSPPLFVHHRSPIAAATVISPSFLRRLPFVASLIMSPPVAGRSAAGQLAQAAAIINLLHLPLLGFATVRHH